MLVHAGIFFSFPLKKAKMKENVGKKERILRIAAGSALLGFGLLRKNWAGALGSIPLATGLFKFCPVNEILGINIVKKPTPLTENVNEENKKNTLKLKLNKKRKTRVN